MSFQISTHPGITFVNPIIQIIEIKDYPINELFTPSVRLTQGGNINVYFTLPEHSYINGTWTDDDVSNYVTNYFDNL